MSINLPLSVIVLTYNEELNIAHSLKNIIDFASDVYVLDSGSTDKTCTIAAEFGTKIFQRKFDNYSNQRNYALKELPIKNEWILFLDADEYLTEELKTEISETLTETEYDGFYLKRRFYFQGKWIKHGGYYPIWILRLFKKEKGFVDRAINEHFKVDGKVGYLKNDFIDDNKKDISEWINKHNSYADYEAMELISAINQSAKDSQLSNFFGSQVERKRWIREKIWNRFLPPLIRPFIYYFYRYFLRLGFLDGKAGFIYHFLQGLWFPFLIDVKYLELKRKSK